MSRRSGQKPVCSPRGGGRPAPAEPPGTARHDVRGTLEVEPPGRGLGGKWGGGGGLGCLGRWVTAGTGHSRRHGFSGGRLCVPCWVSGALVHPGGHVESARSSRCRRPRAYGWEGSLARSPGREDGPGRKEVWLEPSGWTAEGQGQAGLLARGVRWRNGSGSSGSGVRRAVTLAGAPRADGARAGSQWAADRWPLPRHSLGRLEKDGAAPEAPGRLSSPEIR